VRRCETCTVDVRYGHDHATIHAAGVDHAPFARDYAVDEELARRWYGRYCPPCGLTNPPSTRFCLACGRELRD
jgi:hypothetical protein